MDSNELEHPSGRDEAETLPPSAPVFAPSGQFAPEEPATLPPASPPEPPLADKVRVPGYEILSELGRGGMGVVYKARQTGLKRLVALKMILAGSHASIADLERFRAEAEAIARLQHPNIVQIHEVDEAQGTPYFALEFMEGGSLEKQLQGTPRPPGAAAELVETLAWAMHAAHQKGIVHRDLKPANVLLTADGQPKIADFGLAKFVGNAAAGQLAIGAAPAPATATGAILGTPSYMAPEQAGGKGNQVGPAADVYALGAILYELLTGRPPFRAATPLDTLLQVVADEPVSPSRLNSKLPRDLETICLKCLHKLPAQRYADAAGLADDLHRFRNGEPITARPIGRWERLLKWARRRPALAALVLMSSAAAVVLLTVLSASYLLVRQALGEKSQALADLQVEQQKTEESLHREIEAAYVQRIARAYVEWKAGEVGTALRLLQECPAERRGWEWDYLQRLCHAEAWTLEAPWPVAAVAFSADGKRLLSAEGMGLPSKPEGVGQVANPLPAADLPPGVGRLRVWDVKSHTAVATFQPEMERCAAVACSPDGRWVAVAGGATGRPAPIQVWDNQAGRLMRQLRENKDFVIRLAVSPNGKRLAAAGLSENFRWRVLVWDLDTAKVLQTLEQTSLFITGLAFSPDGQRLAVAGTNADLSVRDVKTGRPVLDLEGSAEGVWAVAFSPDGNHLAAGGQDRSVHIWNARTGKRELTCSGHGAAVGSLAFTPDGRLLASSTGGLWTTRRSAEVKIWNAATGQEMATLRGNTGSVSGLAFSPDGKLLASAGDDKTVRVWEVGRDPEARVVGADAFRLPADLAFSRDGRRVATVCIDTEVIFRPLTPGSAGSGIKIWDTTNGKALPPLQGLTSPVAWVVISPHSERLLTVSTSLLSPGANSSGLRVDLWDPWTGRRTGALSGEFNPVLMRPVFSPDARLIGAPGPGGTKIWDGEKGTELLDLPGAATRVKFSPDGKLLAVGTPSGVKVWNFALRREAFSCTDSRGYLPLKFSPEAQRLVIGNGKTLRIWNTTSARQERSLPGSGIEFSPDGKYLACLGIVDKTIRLQEVVSGRENGLLREVVPFAAKFSPDGKYVAAAGPDHTVRVWESATGREVRKLTLEQPSGLAVLNGDWQRFFVVNRAVAPAPAGSVEVRSLITGKPILSFPTPPAHSEGPVIQQELSLDGRLYAAVSLPKPPDVANKGRVQVWNVEEGTELANLPSSRNSPVMALSPDGQRLAVCFRTPTPSGRDERVQVWDGAGKRLRLTLPPRPKTIGALAFDSEGHHLASGCADGSVNIWDSDSGKEITSFHAHDKAVERLKFSPDGKRLASRGKEGVLKVWDWNNGTTLCAISDAQEDLAFSPDGTYVVAAGSKNDARIWDATTGTLVRTLSGHEAPVVRVAFSPDGKRVLTSSWDRSLRVWDAATGREVFSLRGHTDVVSGLGFDRDGHHLAAASVDGTVRIWDATPVAK